MMVNYVALIIGFAIFLLSLAEPTPFGEMIGLGLIFYGITGKNVMKYGGVKNGI